MVAASGGDGAGVGGESRVSSADGGAMAALARKRPDERLGRVKTEAPIMGDAKRRAT